jgi:hypothetical protein
MRVCPDSGYRAVRSAKNTRSAERELVFLAVLVYCPQPDNLQLPRQ